jgi:hypothetical protein
LPGEAFAAPVRVAGPLPGAALPGPPLAGAGLPFEGAAARPGGRPRVPRVSFAAMGLIHYTASAK